jgi:hypothetical protein
VCRSPSLISLSIVFENQEALRDLVLTMFFIFQNSSGAHNRFQVSQFLLSLFSQRNKKTASSLDVSEKVAVAAEPEVAEDLGSDKEEDKFRVDFVVMLARFEETFPTEKMGFPDLLSLGGLANH